MKIGVTSYKQREDGSPQEYLQFLEKMAPIVGSGFLVGPDYALAKLDSINSAEQEEETIQRLATLSKTHKDLCLVAGTMPVAMLGNLMAQRAVVALNGEITTFDKQTDHGEGALAEKYGMTYSRAKTRPNTFNALGRKCWLQICGDRDRKVESRCDDADIEFILALDTNAGFHIGINTPRNPRYIVLSDSWNPKAQILRYSPGEQVLLDGRQFAFSKDKSMYLFNIK